VKVLFALNPFVDVSHITSSVSPSRASIRIRSLYIGFSSLY
jgi:hypothetical protein